MDIKIRIKVGSVEVEYEGADTFLREELPNLLSTMTSSYKESATAPAVQLGPISGEDESAGAAGGIQATTTMIAMKLSCSTGPELVIAAAARLTLVMRKQFFSRLDVLDEMKTASGYYRQSYSNNLSSSLRNLVKAGKLLETAKDTYSLDDITRRELEAKIAG